VAKSEQRTPEELRNPQRHTACDHRSAVKKHGRTTGLTSGKVYAFNSTVNVTYDSGVARFVNQIVITRFLQRGGDSGSLR